MTLLTFIVVCKVVFWIFHLAISAGANRSRSIKGKPVAHVVATCTKREPIISSSAEVKRLFKFLQIA